MEIALKAEKFTALLNSQVMQGFGRRYCVGRDPCTQWRLVVELAGGAASHFLIFLHSL